MAAAEPRSETEVRAAIRAERQQLAESVEELRSELGEATDLGAKVGRHLLTVAGVSLAAGFVLGGGIGASVRYVLRRSRDR
jgi:hypothetical protein